MAIENYVDEIIAIMIVSGYIGAWFMGNPMPSEALMLVIGYYFGKKVSV